MRDNPTKIKGNPVYVIQFITLFYEKNLIYLNSEKELTIMWSCKSQKI